MGNRVQIHAVTWDIEGTRIPTRAVNDPRYEGERFWTRQQMTYSREAVSEATVRRSIETLTTATLASLSVLSYENVSQSWSLHSDRREFPPGKTEHQVYGKHGMWTQVKYSLEAALKDSTADIVVRTRWDIVFKPRARWIFQTSQDGIFQFVDGEGTLKSLQYESCNTSSTDERAVKVLSHHARNINFTGHVLTDELQLETVFLPVRQDITDDMFAFGTRTSMTLYANIYDHIDELMDHLWNMPQPLQSEDIVLLQMFKRGVCVVPFLQRHAKC